MALEPSPMLRAAMELAWLAASRGGDIRQMQAADIAFPDPTRISKMQAMTVTFRRGKTAKKEQYTIGVPLPSPETLSYIKARQEDSTWLFPGLQGEQLKTSLRRVHPQLEQRSFRRGRLQYLAKLGWTDEQLINLSHHASLPMLKRYLDMGVVSSTTHATAALAASSQATC